MKYESNFMNKKNEKQLGYLNEVVLSLLEEKLKAHHTLYPKLSCKAEYLESLLAGIFNDNFLPNTVVIWEPGSHKKGADILIVEQEEESPSTCNFSIKSGRRKKVGEKIKTPAL